ncbi:MAG: bifunctional metallophosphatase/5'-nucleotidase [Erysipelotrichaceae bacterium]|nr:bifunctional metallophosphatase/5'-nucleotidase [Erysipelotrichaceae bacterium]
MKKLNIFLILFLSSCNINIFDSSDDSFDNSNIISSNDSSESYISEYDSSESEKLSSSEESSSVEGSSSVEESLSSEESSFPSDNNDITNKEYYKELVDRSKISYTTYPLNDENHDVSKLEIFQINDTHGAYYDSSDLIGISRVKKCIEENIDDQYACVKIANGDLMQGTAFSNMLLGEPAVASLNEMNFDCFVIGNHEFDWGIDYLSVYKDGNEENGELHCPFLGANIVDKNGNRPSFIEPYTIVNKGNVKVGILGIIGDGLENSISSLSLNGYHFTDTIQTVKTYCDILEKQEKVDVIILASHAHDEIKNQEYVNSNKIDCIINGHDHQKIEEFVTRYDDVKVPVVESNTKNITIGKVELSLDDNKQMSKYSISHFYGSNYSEDSNLKNIMETYYEVVEVYQNSVIGYSSKELLKKDIAVSTCNYLNEKYNADLSFINTAGVRANVSNGNITNASIYEVFPFDNEIYITFISGKDLKSMIPIANTTYYYFDNNRYGNSTTYSFSSIKEDEIYKVITVDYVATKDYMIPYFNDSNGLIKTGDYIRDCAIENVIQNFKK